MDKIITRYLVKMLDIYLLCGTIQQLQLWKTLGTTSNVKEGGKGINQTPPYC